MTSNEGDLKRLMLAGLDGDSAAHRELLSRLSRHFRAYYKSRLRSSGRGLAEAEDLVQEALLAVHTRRHTYDTGEPLTPWLHAIARYKLIDHLRSTKPAFTYVQLDDADEVLARDDVVAAESEYDMQRLLSQLPDKMRRVIQCVKIEGRSVAEAARLFSMSEAAVKVSVHRGLKALAATIARENRHAD
ncbi:MAG: sigma-70 family RNA polymerase sigma factor [Xanthobacteraceae bacterium]|nr:sigma-70 family RNA polymerase sigma factor [Xanthobacteraceae bacterium]